MKKRALSTAIAVEKINGMGLIKRFVYQYIGGDRNSITAENVKKKYIEVLLMIESIKVYIVDNME